MTVKLELETLSAQLNIKARIRNKLNQVTNFSSFEECDYLFVSVQLCHIQGRETFLACSAILNKFTFSRIYNFISTNISEEATSSSVFWRILLSSFCKGKQRMKLGNEDGGTRSERALRLDKYRLKAPFLLTPSNWRLVFPWEQV